MIGLEIPIASKEKKDENHDRRSVAAQQADWLAMSVLPVWTKFQCDGTHHQSHRCH